MLVLSRRKLERVVITTRSGERITVEVCEVRPGKVRIGFHADESIMINRSEVQEQIDQAQRRARP
jgi:carbon storage regulator CsrA